MYFLTDSPVTEPSKTNWPCVENIGKKLELCENNRLLYKIQNSLHKLQTRSQILIQNESTYYKLRSTSSIVGQRLFCSTLGTFSCQTVDNDKPNFKTCIQTKKKLLGKNLSTEQYSKSKYIPIWFRIKLIRLRRFQDIFDTICYIQFFF